MPDNYIPLLHEILDEVGKAKTKDMKVSVLRKHNSDALRMVIKASFDPVIVWDLPAGVPPYEKNEAPEGTEHTMLMSEARKLFHYIKGANNLTSHKREQMFVQLLEGLHQGEAEVLTLAKDKKLHQKYKGLSANVVKEAFNWDDDYKIDDSPKDSDTQTYWQTPGPANG
jgi:hypothetical protein